MAIKPLKVTALMSNSPVDDGVAQALEQNTRFADALQAALDDFRKDWCDKAPLVEEAETFVKKHGGAKKEDIANECTATVACFLKYLDVPEGTIDNVAVNNSTDDDAGGPVDDDAEKEGRDGGRVLDKDDEDKDDGEDEEEGEDEDKEDDEDDKKEESAIARLKATAAARKGAK
jgi:hypothetical protein